MKAVITGVAGFIGSHLATKLAARGASIVGIDNFDRFYGRDRKEKNLARVRAAGVDLDFSEADICDAGAMREIVAAARPDVIFHIAALAGVRPSIEDPARYVKVNLDGLTNMLEAARAADCKAMAFASSSSVYGNNEKVPFAETDDVSGPISPYAATKRSGELLCNTYAHLFGMGIASLRFFTVFGPAQRPDLAISKFMTLIADGESIPMFGDGSTSRDYTFIDDIVAGVMAAGDKAMAESHWHRIYNLGGSDPVTLKEMIDAIAETVGKPAKIDQQPMQPGDVNRTFADIARSASELGYAPKTSFRDGLAKQWEWMQNQG